MIYVYACTIINMLFAVKRQYTCLCSVQSKTLFTRIKVKTNPAQIVNITRHMLLIYILHAIIILLLLIHIMEI